MCCVYWTGVSGVGSTEGRGGKCHNTFVRGTREAPLYIGHANKVRERVKRGEGGREGKEEGGGGNGLMVKVYYLPLSLSLM